MAQEDVFKKIVSHCKEYGFVFPSSDIYDGLGAVYDYGQNGVELKNNIKQYWWQSMVLLHENIVGIDAAIFMHPTTWKASGHVDAFNDPLIDNRDSKKRYRADVLIEDQIAKYEEKINKEIAKAVKKFGDSFDEQKFRETNPRVLEHQQKRDALHQRYSDAMNAGDLNELKQIILDEGIVCPISGTHNWTDVRQFNLMFKTEVGSTAEGSSHYLPASGNRPRHLRELPERAEDGAHEAAFRYRTDRQGVPQRNRGPSVYFPYARVRANGNAVFREARYGASMVRNVEEDPYGLASGIRLRSGKLPFPRP